jgi:hypothetical protein
MIHLDVLSANSKLFISDAGADRQKAMSKRPALRQAQEPSLQKISFDLALGANRRTFVPARHQELFAPSPLRKLETFSRRAFLVRIR